METFGARDERPPDECRRLVRESDVFVGVYAHRYGHVPRGSTTSMIEQEYDEAVVSDRPRLLYTIAPDWPWNPQWIETGEAADKLASLLTKLKDERMVQDFRSEDNLASLVAIDLGRFLREERFERVDQEPAVGNSPLPAPWTDQRQRLYEESHNIMLAHTVLPSVVPGQRYDVAIFLKGHKGADLAVVQAAEFFLGEMWGNRVYLRENKGHDIGIVTSCYGEFLCLCHILFRDGTTAVVSRYIDFG